MLKYEETMSMFTFYVMDGPLNEHFYLRMKCLSRYSRCSVDKDDLFAICESFELSLV